MTKALSDKIREKIKRSISPIEIEARESVEVSSSLEGRERSADIFECLIKGGNIRLYAKEVRINRTFFKEGEVFLTYELDRTPSEPFSLKEVLDLLKDEGYYIPESLYEEGRENYSLSKRTVKRDEKGRARFFQNLRTFGIDGLTLTLDYVAEREGSFLLKSEFTAPIKVDLGMLSTFRLGILDYKKEVTREKKEGIISYLKALNQYLMYSGLEIMNIIDYMTLIEAMEVRDKRKDFSIFIRKERSEYAKRHPNFGGRSYSDFGITITPLDFSYYVDGFSDSDDERNIFFSYYDSKGTEYDRKYYLSVLDLDESATLDDIERAYRKKIKAFHPDRIASLDLDDAFISFANLESARLNEAYEALTKRP